MSLRTWIKYDLPRLLRWRPSPFEVALALGVLLFLGVVGAIGWGMLPSSSLGRYDASIGAKVRAADHFPARRSDLPEGSRFYRGMNGSVLALYTPGTPAEAEALLEARALMMRGEASVLREMDPVVRKVVPASFDLQRANAVWGRVSAPPWIGLVWCDPSTGEVVYIARTK